MRLLFIRHGDPDYDNDRLTQIGQREAMALSKLTPSMNLGDCYVSPLGRAQETAQIALRDVRDENGEPVRAKTLDWLREFPTRIDGSAAELLKDAYFFSQNSDGTYKRRITWDMYPRYYFGHPQYRDEKAWRETLVAKNSNIISVYEHVVSAMDELLASYGYVRDGAHYRVEKENRGTVTFFCHFGITSVFLSHFWNTSPFVPMQSLCMAPTSVTELVTEERQQGIAHFRTVRAGDITHLTMAGIEPTNRALFTEVYSDQAGRHE